MGIKGCFFVLKPFGFSVFMGTLLVFTQTLTAGPAVPKDKFPDYNPAHTVIKCPYLPPGLVEIPTCGGQQATCLGTESHDLILGSEQNDVIVAAAGNDVVHADALDDIVCGGPGDDFLFGARGRDILYGGPGDDMLFGAVDTNELYGGEGDFDVLWAGPNIEMDYMDGGAGSHDTCLLQMGLGQYSPEGCNTAIQVADVCLPASVTAPALVEPEKHEDE